MFAMLIIAVFCGLFSILFIVSEINEGLNNFNRLLAENRGIYRLTLTWKWFGAFKTLIFDVGITLFVVWLFSMSGIIGMVVSLMASGFISAFLLLRRWKRGRESLPYQNNKQKESV